MKIVQTIYDASRYWSASHRGNRPDYLYLGDIEYKELRQIGEFFMRVNTDPHRVERLTFDGMKVFRVDATSFIAFGEETPSPCG